MSDLSPDLDATFTSRGWEPLLVELTPHPSLLVQEFYTDIHDVSRSTFKVFLRGKMIKITPDVISSLVHTPRVVHPLFPYLSVDTLSTDSLIRSVVFNTPLGGGSRAICTGSLPTNRQILLRIVCTNLWPMSHIFSLPIENVRFLYALLHGDSIELPSFICHFTHFSSHGD